MPLSIPVFALKQQARLLSRNEEMPFDKACFLSRGRLRMTDLAPRPQP